MLTVLYLNQPWQNYPEHAEVLEATKHLKGGEIIWNLSSGGTLPLYYKWLYHTASFGNGKIELGKDKTFFYYLRNTFFMIREHRWIFERWAKPPWWIILKNFQNVKSNQKKLDVAN